MKRLILVALVFSSGCATHGSFLTSEHDGWFDTSSPHGLVYCKANDNPNPPNSGALPTCYEARYAP